MRYNRYNPCLLTCIASVQCLALPSLIRIGAEAASQGTIIFSDHAVERHALSTGLDPGTVGVDVYAGVGSLPTEAAVHGTVVLDCLEGVGRAGTEAGSLVLSTGSTETVAISKNAGQLTLCSCCGS